MYNICTKLVFLTKISTPEMDSTKYYSQNNKNSFVY